MRTIRVTNVLLVAPLTSACGSGPVEIAFSDLLVAVHPTGPLPSTGYRVLLVADQPVTRDRQAAIAPNGSILFRELIGKWTVTLTQVEAGCEVEGPPSRTVNLDGRRTLRVHFAVRCSD